MKKLICLLLCALLLCGCTQEQIPTVPSEPTEAPTRPVVEVPMEEGDRKLKYEGVQLTYWSLLAETDAQAQILKQAAADFRQTTGAVININWQAGDEAGLIESLTGDLQADIFEVSGGGLKERLLTLALDLTELAENANYEEKSWDVLRSQMISRCGMLAGIPYRPWLYGLYYNRQVFDDFGVETGPSTWQEYLDFCQMLKDNGYEGLAMDAEKAHLTLELHMERALGWEDLKETMVYGKWRENETAGTRIQEAIGFAEAGYLVKSNPVTWPLGQNRLANSNAVFVAGSNVLCKEVQDDTQSDMRWGVMAYPGDGPGTGLLVDADVLAIHKSCTAPEAAFEFIMLLTTGEYDQLRADVSVGIPADPNNSSPITGAAGAMAAATPQAPKWFASENKELFGRLWNGYYKTGIYFADQLNVLSRNFAHEKSVG